VAEFVKEAPLKCYRVWFADDTALLCDAYTAQHAKEEALRLAIAGSKVTKVECLDD